VGDVRGASRLLGRPHWVSGQVQKGDQRGRTLGFPTANLHAILQTCPAEGVYAAYAFLVNEDEEQALGPAVVHLGARPSVDRPPTFEVHLLDQDLDLYGKSLGVAFVERIRGVEKFANVEELRQQITRDIQVARGQLNALESSPS
jgi:riboflavin kinase / FMN adenylyltransferase